MPSGARTPWRIWLFTLVLGIVGVVLDPLGWPVLASAAYLTSIAVFLLRAAIRAQIGFHDMRWLFFVVGAGALESGLLIYKYGTLQGAPQAAALTASGAQLLLFSLSLRRLGERRKFGRSILIIFGHAAGWLGGYTLLVNPGTATFVTGMSYSTALLLLSLDAYWVHRTGKSGDTLRTWEAPFLLLFLAGTVSLYLTPVTFSPDPFLTVLAWLKLSLLLSLALLSGPPQLPSLMRARPGGIGEFLTQGLVLGVALNIALLLILVAWPALTVPFLVLITSWLFLAVVGEYAAFVHGRRRLRQTAAGGGTMRLEPLTVVIAAMNEAATIAATVEAALILPRVERVIVIVGARSTDDTFVRVEKIIPRSRDRLVLLRGTTSSKAEDLNEAWRFVTTSFVLILDADERVDLRTLGRAFHHFEDPQVGIVQGRKLAKDPHRTIVDRFVAVERRFSTLFDQTFQAEAMHAAHFAGSASIVRAAVPGAIGGWSPATLTEDIDFTLRLYLSTPYRIVYDPGFLVYEESPRKLGPFLRQRGRWARGWAQVAGLYLGRVLRHPTMPRRRKMGLAWQLITAISAPWSVFLPAAFALWTWGSPLKLPLLVAVVLGVVILPSRLVTYVHPYFHDPARKTSVSTVRLIGTGLAAYTWVLVGWMLQLQALYLELSDAPKVWRSTRQLSGQLPEGGTTGAEGGIRSEAAHPNQDK